MVVDPRQILAAFLTLTMFAMLGNMIKNDHFDSAKSPEPENTHFDAVKIEEKEFDVPVEINKGPWKGNGTELKPCWQNPVSKEVEQSKGYITFSLTSGPEYHVSQIGAAVLIARYLKATLVLPDIRGSVLGQKRKFQDIYDAEKFVDSLRDIITIVQELPADVANKKPAVIRVPNRVTEDYIMKNIQPDFQMKKHVRLAVYFPSINMKIKGKYKNEMKSIGCLATYGVLDLKPGISEVVDLIVERLKILSRKSDGQFISVDLRVDLLEHNGCKESEGNTKKLCYNADEIAQFLRNLGFNADATIYLTQTGWHESLNNLKHAFPKTYTKDDILPPEKHRDILQSGDSELQKVLDFYVCSRSDVFVPAISGLFYGNVVGRRIASGRTQIFVPRELSGASASPADFISSYITKKNHIAYSCYC